MAEEDVLYGKLRHLFGGIEPSNMKTFAVAYASENEQNRAKITAVLPDDTVVEEQTLCTVAGAIIRRKLGSPVENEFDGFLVKDLKSSETFYDEEVEADNTYYYAAYPYTTQGVYNRNPQNAAAVTILRGYPPDPLTTFTAESAIVEGKPQIKLTIGMPSNNVVDGVQVNTVEGAIVRRSTTSYPLTENDGDFVVDAKVVAGNPRIFYDINVELETTYYYSAFVYTTQDVYNRDAVSHTTAMATGTIPKPMALFEASNTPIGEKAAVTLTYKVPETVEGLDTVTIPIRRKTGSYPINIGDGDLVTTVYGTPGDTETKTYIDKSVNDGVTYYYRAFPTSPDGIINTETTPNETSIQVQEQWIFGFVILPNTTTTNPSLRVSYDVFKDGNDDGRRQVDNKDFTPAKMDYSRGVFDYGSWNFAPGTFFMPRPCILGYDGTVRYYLDPNDYTKKEDGTPSDIAKDPGTILGNVMMEWPFVWFYTAGYNNTITVMISNKQISNKFTAHGNFRSLTFNNTNKDHVDHFYTSVYPTTAFTVNSKTVYQSVSGQHPTMLTGSGKAAVSTVGNNCTNVAVSSNSVSTNKNWSLNVATDHVYIQILLILMGKSLDTQSVYGCGSIGVSSQATVNSNITTGIHDKKGLFWGSQYSSSNLYPGIKIFGMEDYWGGLGQLTGTLAIGYDNDVLSQYGFDTVSNKAGYVSVYKAEPINYGDNPDGQTENPGYNPADGIGTFRLYSKDNRAIVNAGKIHLAQRDADGYVIQSSQLNSSYMGSGYITNFERPSNSSTVLWYPYMLTDPYSNTPNYYGGYNVYLNGSATTNYCDYLYTKDLPTSSTSSNVVYAHFGSDQTITNETTLKQIGAFYTAYTSSLVGTGVRLAYRDLKL